MFFMVELALWASLHVPPPLSGATHSSCLYFLNNSSGIGQFNPLSDFNENFSSALLLLFIVYESEKLFSVLKFPKVLGNAAHSVG